MRAYRIRETWRKRIISWKRHRTKEWQRERIKGKEGEQKRERGEGKEGESEEEWRNEREHYLNIQYEGDEKGKKEGKREIERGREREDEGFEWSGVKMNKPVCVSCLTWGDESMKGWKVTGMERKKDGKKQGWRDVIKTKSSSLPLLSVKFS